MYVAVKGGERAIRNAYALLADKRRGDKATPEIAPEQIEGQFALAVDRVMSEGSLYDRRVAALAMKQARGDLIEAIFLARAYRTTLPRFGFAEPIDTGAMRLARRISATFKDLPGGQVLGPTFDYSHRLIDFDLETPADPAPPATALASPEEKAPRVTDLIARDDLIEREAAPAPHAPVSDVTRDAQSFPSPRDGRLQSLARGDEGFLLGLAYSTQRGYGRTHPFVGEIRFGEVEVELFVEDLGFAVPLGDHHRSCRSGRHRTASVGADPGSGMEAGVVPDSPDPRVGRRNRLCFGQAARRHGGAANGRRVTRCVGALRSEDMGELSTEEIAARRRAMWLFARARAPELAGPLAARWADHGARDLKPVETGLVMLRGRIGGDGAPFNFGEATVTRAIVELSTGERGYGHVLGRDADKARDAAVLDALWQTADRRAAIETDVLRPIEARLFAERVKASAETAATRVDFFTLVRGEDDA